MYENRIVLQESPMSDFDTPELIHTDNLAGKDPIILCALVVVGLLGFLYILHCLNRNDFSPKYIQKNSFELTHNISSSDNNTSTVLLKK